MRYTTVLVLLAVAPAISDAESIRLRNNGSDVIVMKYRARAKRPQAMNEVEFKPDEEKEIDLFDEDPYDVSFALRPRSDSNGTARVFHAKVSKPIRLRALAGKGPFDISLAIAASNSASGLIYQASTATLQSQSQRVEIYSQVKDDQQLVHQILQQRWDTEYVAGNGNLYQAIIDFGKLSFQTSDFTGRFTDLAVFDDDDGCHIVGQWKAADSSGDVFFTVKRNSPSILKGEYTFKGHQQRRRWSSR